MAMFLPQAHGFEPVDWPVVIARRRLRGRTAHAPSPAGRPAAPAPAVGTQRRPPPAAGSARSPQRRALRARRSGARSPARHSRPRGQTPHGKARPVRTIVAGTLWENATQMPAIIACVLHVDGAGMEEVGREDANVARLAQHEDFTRLRGRWIRQHRARPAGQVRARQYFRCAILWSEVVPAASKSVG